MAHNPLFASASLLPTTDIHLMNLNVLSILGFMILIVAIAGLLLTHSLIADAPVLLSLQFLALFLMVWARITFGRRSFHASARPTEGGLVTSGPYRFIRHPIYAAVLYFIWIGALAHISPSSILLLVAGTAGSFLRIIAEEKLLLERYPEYAAYSAQTKRIIPFML